MIPALSAHTQMEKSVKSSLCCMADAALFNGMCMFSIWKRLGLTPPPPHTWRCEAATVISIQVSFKSILNRWVLKRIHSVTDTCRVCLRRCPHLVAFAGPLRSLPPSLVLFLYFFFAFT